MSQILFLNAPLLPCTLAKLCRARKYSSLMLARMANYLKMLHQLSQGRALHHINEKCNKRRRKNTDSIRRALILQISHFRSLLPHSVKKLILLLFFRTD